MELDNVSLVQPLRYFIHPSIHNSVSGLLFVRHDSIQLSQVNLFDRDGVTNVNKIRNRKRNNIEFFIIFIFK